MSSRLKPHHIVRIIGVGVALFTFGSYLAPFVFEFDEASDVTRKVFGNVPAGVKLAFYTTIPMLIVYGGWVASYRVKNWERGRPDNRRTTLKNAKRAPATSAPASTCRPCCANWERGRTR